MPQNKWDKKLGKNISGYDSTLERLYRDVITEASAIGASVADMARDSFEWSKHPNLRKRLDALVRVLNSDVYTVIVDGIDSAWTLANNKNNELCRQVFGDKIGKLTDEQYKRYFSTNGDAKDAFLTRKTAGLNLSDRVWKYTSGYKDEIETALELGIKEGKSAASMTRDLNDYLQYPDKLFRRVRDAATGKLHLSKPALKFIEENHPGQGVYLSSFKNARRLAATETNIAYRTADYLRYQQEDLVVGIRIGMSNNHPVPDICDELKGDYPKDFKFVGWHPHCRCVAVPILKTEEELFRDNERILNGEEPLEDSVNRVGDVPANFYEWIQKNAERSEKIYSKPYFVFDNPKYIPNDYLVVCGAKLPYPTYAEYEQAMRYNRIHANFSPEQLENIKELNEVLPVIQGQIMPFGAADSTHSNPHYYDVDARLMGYRTNCQTCTMTYELRRRGFDVEALPSPKGKDDYYWAWAKKNGITSENNFLTVDRKPVPYLFNKHRLTDARAREQYIIDQTKEIGRYEISCEWSPNKQGERTAHVFIVERQKDGHLLWHDPQCGLRNKAIKDDYLTSMAGDNLGVRRIDDKLVNPKISSRLQKSIN